MALVTPAVISAPTVIAVGDSPPPLPETTPVALAAPVTEPTETPRREQRSLFDLDPSTSPWWIIGIISLIALAAVVLALIFFRGDKEETGGG